MAGGSGGRVYIKADDIGSFLRKIGIVALTPGLTGLQIDFVVPKAAPDILNVDIVQRLGQQRTCLARKSWRRWLVQLFQNPFIRSGV